MMVLNAKPRADDSDDQVAPLTLSALAKQALAAARGDTRKAREALRRRLLKDRALQNSILDGAIRDAVVYRTEHAMRHDRAAIFHAHAQLVQHGRNDVIAQARGISSALLDMPLAGGLLLRKANRDQVSKQAIFYAALSRDTGHKGRWLSLIAQSVPDGKLVGDIIDDARAAELFEECA
jgi:hypothetical protein